jgi:hypothetical protein
MKDRFKYFIYLSVLIFIPRVFFSQPGIKDSTMDHNYPDQRGIIVMVYASVGDSLKMSAGAVIKTEAKPAEPTKKKIIPVWMWIVTGFLPGFLAGGLLIYQYSKSKIYSILAAEKYKYLDNLKQDTGQNLLLTKCFKYVGIVALLKHSKDEKKNAIGNNNKEIAQLKKQNEKLRTENEQKEKVITDYKIIADNQVSAREHFDGQPDKSYGISDAKPEIFFTIPEGDGSFKATNAKNGQDIDCFYKIVPEKGGQRGKLYFVSGNYDLRALDNIDYYLSPVCEIQNITDRTFARKIVMTDPGIVIKRGDYWKIEDNCKVKIKLI